MRLQASFFGPPRLCGSLPAVSRQAPGAHFVAIFSNFRVSKLHSKFCMEKTSQKVRKSWILASQSLPKTLSKSSSNRCPKKHAIFHRFLFEKCSVPKMPTSIPYWFLPIKMALGRFSSNRCLQAFSIQKTYQKPFQNEVRTLPKSMPKTCCFLTSIFRCWKCVVFGFQPRFWRVLGLQVRRAACSARRFKPHCILCLH